MGHDKTLSAGMVSMHGSSKEHCFAKGSIADTATNFTNNSLIFLKQGTKSFSRTVEELSEYVQYNTLQT